MPPAMAPVKKSKIPVVASEASMTTGQSVLDLIMIQADDLSMSRWCREDRRGTSASPEILPDR